MKLYLTVILIFFNPVLKAQDEFSGCGFNQKAKELARLIMLDSGQKRTQLVCNKELARIALKKARQMSETDKVAHYINHVSPNELLSKEGLQLPYTYAILGNQVEAVQGGAETAQEAFDNFLNSYYHKEHLLGENNFYNKQTQIGVGYINDKSTLHEDFWVVYITALRSEDDKKNIGYQLKLNVEPLTFQKAELNTTDSSLGTRIKTSKHHGN